MNSRLLDTNANRKRIETNQKKLKIVNQNVLGSHTPQINPPMKKSLYDQEYIKKYLIDKACLDEEKRRFILEQSSTYS